MGQLEIRRSSAQLNSLGQFRMPELDNGSGRVFEAQANAAKAAADAAGVKGRAAIAGITRRGQVVNETLQHLGRLAVDLFDRENERVATNAFIENEKERNLFMTGDGTPENPGMMNRPFDNAATWLGQLKEENERRLASRTKGMNAAQRRIFMDKVNAREVEWQKRIGEHAAAQTMKNEVATAANDVTQAKDHAIAAFSDPTFRDKAIREFYDAKAHELDVRLVPEGARKAEMRKATEDLLLTLARQKFTEWGNETYDNGDPSEVERLWNERGKILESLNGKVPTNELIRQHLGSDTLDEARRELLTKKFNEARTAAIGRSYALRRENWDKARSKSVSAELELHKARPPEEPKEREAYFAKMASDYGKLAENTALEPSVRLQYAKMAETLASHSHSEKDAAKRADAALRKAEIDSNEEGLASAFCQLRMLERDGSIPQDEANAAQAAIWQKFRACTLEKSVSPGFMQTFQARMETRLTDQEANAMRRFYQAFGYAPDLKGDGEAGTAERNAAKKDSTDYYAPLEEDGQKVESRKTRIKATELLGYGDSLLATLRSLGPDINREGVVDREIARLRTGWMKGEIDKNRDATVRSVLDMQREARTRMAAGQDGTSKKENKGDGRDGEEQASK